MELSHDSIVLPKTHPPMYLIHKYWARKPHNVVKSYIEKYTNSGDIVLDPFSGSGVTIAESLIANRNCIGIDINPFSKFLTECTITPINIDKFQKSLNQIYSELDEIINELYGTTCPFCGNSAQLSKLIWKNHEQDTQKPPIEEIQEIRLKCEKCNLRNHIIDADEFSDTYNYEYRRISRIDNNFEKLKAKYNISIPEISFTYKNGRKFKQIRHFLIKNPTYHQLFTNRNLLILGAIRNSIDKITPKNGKSKNQLIRNLLLLTFSANLGQSSKMVWVISRRKSKIQKKKEVGSWTHHFFWNPREFFEINPLIGFKTRARKSILGQKNLRKRLKRKNVGSIHKFKDWDSFNKSILDCKTMILCASAHKLPLPDESVDYIFTDPPYGDSIQYYELTSLWNSWLEFPKSFQVENEIVINPRQQKRSINYFSQLTKVFEECYRVLKNNSYMTITFHNTDIKIRNGLIQAVQKGGFRLDSLLLQMPARNSLKSYLHYEKSPVGDYFLRFKKDLLTNDSTTQLKTEEVMELIQKTIIDVLVERAEPTNLSFIYNCIDEELVNNQSFPLKNTDIVQQTLQSMIDNHIIFISMKNVVTLIQTEPIKGSKTPLTIRIHNFLEKIENLHKLNYSEIYNMVYEHFNGWNTPDRKETTKIIEKIR